MSYEAVPGETSELGSNRPVIIVHLITVSGRVNDVQSQPYTIFHDNCGSKSAKQETVGQEPAFSYASPTKLKVRSNK